MRTPGTGFNEYNGLESLKIPPPVARNRLLSAHHKADFRVENPATRPQLATRFPTDLQRFVEGEKLDSKRHFSKLERGMNATGSSSEPGDTNWNMALGAWSMFARAPMCA